MNYKECIHKWTKGQLSSNPGYYAGRRPSTFDLSTKTLENIYTGIRSDVSQQAATNFVRFVAKLKDLSATSFIVAFEQFAESDFTKVEIEQQPKDHNTLSSGDEKFTQGFMVVAQALSGNNLDRAEIESLSKNVKYEFIQRHRGELTKEELAAAI